MKQVILTRAWDDKRATLGMLKIVDVEHDPIFTLENPERDTKVDSRIPAGDYLCVPYSGTKYKNVYLVRDVPGRTAILIHWGNYESDTEGCILLGTGSGMMNGKPAVMNSKVAFDQFRSLVGREDFRLLIV